MATDRVRVYSHQFLASAQLVADHLDAHGIPAQVTGQHLTGLGGLIPFTDTYAEVWVAQEHAHAAAALVAGVIAPPEQGGLSLVPDEAGALAVVPESCPACGAEAEPGFDVCWQCGETLG